MERREQTWYEALGLGLGAPAEQVERAYRFYRDLYREDSLATYSLLSPQELLAARARVQEAYEVLGDPERRLSYDLTLGLPVAAPSEVPPPASTPGDEPTSEPPLTAPSAPPVVATSTLPSPPSPSEPPPLPEPVTGPALKAYRLAKGVSLRDIANQSKIGVRFLEYLEADRFGDLPAPVYIRGFLKEYTRACGLDPSQVTDSYLSRLSKP